MSTTNTTSVFTFSETREIRTLMENGEPLFNANDVCGVLEYANSRDAIATHVDDDDVAKREVIDTLGRSQQANYLTEAGVYSLIFGCQLPAAKNFKRWVTHEVLPQLRKVGFYG